MVGLLFLQLSAGRLNLPVHDAAEGLRHHAADKKAAEYCSELKLEVMKNCSC
jgi:hypothetical protein